MADRGVGDQFLQVPLGHCDEGAVTMEITASTATTGANWRAAPAQSGERLRRKP